MKIYCIVNGIEKIIVRGDYCFELATEFDAIDKAIKIACLEQRPMSLRMGKSWITRDLHRLPISVGAISFRRTLFITNQPILSR